MKEIEPTVKDVKSILKEYNHTQTYRPFYNDKRKNGRRIKMPFLLDSVTARYLQKELTNRFPAYTVSVKEHSWESHWQYVPAKVTTVHITNA
jgi:hypothetical protein